MADQQPLATTTEQQPNPTTHRVRIWVSYKVDFRTRLRLSLYSLAQFFRIMSKPNESSLLEFKNIDDKGFQDINAYCDSLRLLYTDPKTHKTAQDRWKIARISTYKYTGDVQHEYLIAEARNGKDVVYMRIERKVSPSKVVKGILGASQSASFGASSSAYSGAPSSFQPNVTPILPDDSGPSSDSGAPPGDAEDLRKDKPFTKIARDGVGFFSKLSDSTSKSKLVDDVNFRDHFPMPRLAILASCVNKSAGYYELLGQNCYFFAQVTCEALKIIHPDHDQSSPKAKGKRGHWRGLPAKVTSTDSEIDEMINKVVPLFHEEWKSFNKTIFDTVNNPESEIFQDERRKREDAERIAAEREERENDERRKREKAERMEKEERQKREEERRKREEAERSAAEKDDKIKKLEAKLAAMEAGKST